MVCCNKRQKSPKQETGLGNREPLEALNDTKLILNDLQGQSCSLRTNFVSFRTFKCPIFPKPVSWLGLFLRFLQETGSNNFSKSCIIPVKNLTVFKIHASTKTETQNGPNHGAYTINQSHISKAKKLGAYAAWGILCTQQGP